MSITITIENAQVEVRSCTSGKTGKPYSIKEQRCIVHGAARFPLETRITLSDDHPGYAVGTYEVTTPFTVGRFGLQVARDLGLVLIKNAKAA